MANYANALQPASRNDKGQFVTGGPTPNPFGPAGYRGAHIRILARSWTDKAIARLGAALDGPDSTAIRAAEILLERAWGKPVQPVDLTVISLEDLDQLIAELTERLAAQAGTDQVLELEAEQVTEQVTAEPEA